MHMVISDPQHTECLNFKEARWNNRYVIIKTICPLNCLQNGSVATHPLWQMIMHICPNEPKIAKQAIQGA